MKKAFGSLIFVCLFFFSLSQAVEAGTLYAVDDSTDSFYSIHTTTGAATLIGPCGEDLSFSGLAYDTSTGTMYVSDVRFAGGWGLGTVDIATGAVTFIGGHITTSNIHGLAYDSLNDIFYGADTQGPGLAIIDRSTGAATFVGLWGAGITNIRGLAYDPGTDTLYGIDPANLYTIDRATGAATVVGPHGITSGWYIGLGFDSDTQILYASENITGDLYFLNTTTGAATLIGSTSIAVSGLASVPVPTGAPHMVPTMTEWGMIIFMVLAGLGSVYYLKKQKMEG